MKNPFAFTVSTLVVLLGASLIFYCYGLPMLTESSMGCRYGGGTKSLGCSTSFGTFMTFLGAAVALAIGVIWSRFGRH
jgi:hypothetical protein